MVFASASGSSGKPKPKPQQWSSELPTYITVYVSKPVSQTVEPPIPNDIVAFVPPAPTISTSPPRPSRPAGPGVSRPQPAPSDPPADAERQERPDERRGSSDTTQNQAPTKPDYAPDEEEESETVAVDREKAWSYEDIFLSMDAVDLSYYSSLREYDLVREAAISLRHEKLILFYLDKPREYLKHFATYTWDEEADSATEEFIQWYVERFRPELERQLDILTSGPAFGEAEEAIEDLTFGVEEDKFKDLTVGDVEDAIKDPTFGEAEDTITRWHQDLTNDEREVVIAIDLITGETLFVRYGDEDSVTLHDEQKELVEDRYVALLHHHPKNGAASLADLDATKWLKGEFLLVSNPDGTLHRYARVGEAMIPLEPTRNPEYAAPVDPMETALADAAYLAQTLLEMGNPPERVMEQGEELWWQEENIIVPYRTDETIEEVAFRLIGPPPSEELYGDRYERLQEEYKQQLTQFTTRLTKLNPDYSRGDAMNIFLPGWSSQEVLTSLGPQIVATHATGATFLNRDLATYLSVAEIVSRWNSLSPVQQQIEMAMMGSDARIDKFVRIDNAGRDFDFTLTWLKAHENTINQAADDFEISSTSLNTTLGSEIMYDYGPEDSRQDKSMGSGFRDLFLRLGDLLSWERLQESWDGAGIANAHYPALTDAYDHIDAQLERGEMHPWKLDPDAPDLALARAPRLVPSAEDKSAYVERWADYYDNRSFDDLSEREQAVALFWIRAEKLDEVPWDLRQDIAYYAATVEGSARIAAMINRMYSDQLKELDSTADVWDNPRDIARVWGRYRSADQYFDYLGNAHLAYPIADHFSRS